jgi:hypothetical protein
VKGSSAWNKETGAQNESMTYDQNGNIKSLQRTQRKHQLNGAIASSRLRWCSKAQYNPRLAVVGV